MRERSDTLHLNRIHLLERMVQDTRSIDHLPSHVSIIQMSDEERLGGECVWLDVDIRTGDFVDEG